MRAWVLPALALGLAACASTPGGSSEQCLLSVQEDGGTLVQLNMRTGEQRAYPIGLRPHEITLSRDRVFAYVSQFGLSDVDHTVGVAGDHITRVNLRAGEIVHWPMPPSASAPHGIQFHNGEVYANAEVGHAMAVYDAQTGELKRSFPLPAAVHQFTFARNGDILAHAADAGVFRLNAQTGAVLAQASVGSSARGVWLTRDGREVLVAARGEVVFLNVSDLSVARRFPVRGVGQIIYAMIDERSGLIFAPVPSDGVVVVLDRDTGAERARITDGRRPIIAVSGPDGRVYISSVANTFVTAVDTTTFQTEHIGAFQQPNGLAFGACRAG